MRRNVARRLDALRALTRSSGRLWHDLTHGQQPLLWLLAVIVGALSGTAAAVFDHVVDAVSHFAWGADDRSLAAAVGAQSWLRIVTVATLGGALVGLMLRYLCPTRRGLSVADIMEARAIHRARVAFRPALASIATTAASLGLGASLGREGPIAHFGAALASVLARQLESPPIAARTLMGCGVAAAVAVSFNTPLAGVLFALEVVLGHYALRAFAPVVIASVMGVVVADGYFGGGPLFTLENYGLRSYWEMPAFGMLGAVSAVVAVIFMRALFFAEWVANRIEEATRAPLPVRTASAGLMLGLIIAWRPEAMSVGYEPTNAALQNAYSLSALIAIALAKAAATAVCFAGRLAGGVFSPSVVLGAMTGGAFGVVATHVAPQFGISNELYALVGMAAVAAAVLGAPISTSLIVFEMTSNLGVAMMVMTSVSVASACTQYMTGGRSFFLWQLDRRGLPLHRGPNVHVLAGVTVKDVMRKVEPLSYGADFRSDAPRFERDEALTDALTRLNREDIDRAAVVDENDAICGVLYRVDALQRANHCLLALHEEEHR